MNKTDNVLASYLEKEDMLIKVSEFFKVFGDHTRIRIIILLADGEKPVQTIADSLNMTQSAISHQLRLLKNNRVVKSRRDGKNIHYSLDDDHVQLIVSQGLSHIEHIYE